MNAPPQSVRLTTASWLRFAGMMGGLCLAGCQSLPMPFAGGEALENSVESDPDYSIAGIQGPTERKLNAALWEQRRHEAEEDPSDAMAGALESLDKAQKLYDAQKYREAEKAFKQVAADRRKTYESFRARWERWWGFKDQDSYDPYSNFGDPIEEDAMFMLAQAQFAQRRFANAQDSYDALLEKYPSTRHLDTVTRQLFRIARYWLDFPEDVGENGDAEVKLAALEEPERKEPDDEGFDIKAIPVIPNLTDRTRPLFDTYGRGLQALRSIWLHDATGPLADDALMLAANHNLRKENFIEAARLYSLLREQYPDSQHYKDAYILGSHVALASYEGPSYDSASLEEAVDLKETALTLFPNLDPELQTRLKDELRRLHEAEIARQWDIVEFYQRKGIPESVALHCYLIINRYPDSRYAEKARQTLADIEPELHRQTGGGFWAFLRGAAPEPSLQNQKQPAGSAVLDEQNRITLPAEADPDSTAGEPPEPETQKPKRGFFGSFLRRLDTPPKLEKVPEDNDDGSSPPGKATL